LKIPLLGHEPSTPSCSLALWLSAVRYRMTARVLRRLDLAEMNGIYIYIYIRVFKTRLKFRAFYRLVQN
jgi:hypothetical protein